MHPLLYDSGSITIYNYGLLVMAGYAAAYFFGAHLCRQRSLSPTKFRELALITIIASLVGGRALYVILEWDFFVKNPEMITSIWKGGFVYYGGLLTALLAGAIYLGRMEGKTALALMDISAPAIALGHAIGRVGCFLAGCCYGTECSLPFAATFTDLRSLARIGVPLHPVQIYEVAVNLLIFFFLLRWWKGTKDLEGRVFAGYLMVYPLFRFVLEFYRGDERGGAALLSTSQLLGIPIFMAGVALLLHLDKRQFKSNRTESLDA